jgi:hypothetical protein
MRSADMPETQETAWQSEEEEEKGLIKKVRK